MPTHIIKAEGLSKIVSAKKISALVMVVVFCFAFSLQAFAATGYFSGTTVKLNALNGGSSVSSNISSGSIPSTAVVTGVIASVTVSNGSSSFYLYVKNPAGTTIASQLVAGSSGVKNVTFTDFNGQDPQGTWKVWIVTTGTVSTATVRLTVNYSY
jgi:hypothetical protein